MLERKAFEVEHARCEGILQKVHNVWQADKNIQNPCPNLPQGEGLSEGHRVAGELLKVSKNVLPFMLKLSTRVIALN